MSSLSFLSVEQGRTPCAWLFLRTVVSGVAVPLREAVLTVWAAVFSRVTGGQPLTRDPTDVVWGLHSGPLPAALLWTLWSGLRSTGVHGSTNVRMEGTGSAGSPVVATPARSPK